MNKIVLAGLICLFACRPQSKEAALINLPAFDILLSDSATVLNTNTIRAGSPIVLMFFRPDCPHCNKEAQELVDHIDSFRNVRFYLVTVQPLKDIKGFSLAHHLEQFSNFIIGKDEKHVFAHTFRPSSIPYMAIYDGNKKLVKIYNGGADMDYIIKATRS